MVHISSWVPLYHCGRRGAKQDDIIGPAKPQAATVYYCEDHYSLLIAPRRSEVLNFSSLQRSKSLSGLKSYVLCIFIHFMSVSIALHGISPSAIRQVFRLFQASVKTFCNTLEHFLAKFTKQNYYS